MDTILTPSNIMFALGIIGILFTIFNYFRNPQVASDKEDALISQRVDGISKQMTELSTSFQAHVQQDLTSLGLINERIGSVNESVVRLATIIDERIPRNKNSV